jgi:oligopeptidase B
MVTPATVYDYHPAEKRLETRKVQEIPSGYDASLYVTERLMIEARDGAKVPVSVLRRRDFQMDGGGKLFVYGYGAYGYAIPPASRPLAEPGRPRLRVRHRPYPRRR